MEEQTESFVWYSSRSNPALISLEVHCPLGQNLTKILFLYMPQILSFFFFET